MVLLAFSDAQRIAFHHARKFAGKIMRHLPRNEYTTRKIHHGRLQLAHVSNVDDNTDNLISSTCDVNCGRIYRIKMKHELQIGWVSQQTVGQQVACSLLSLPCRFDHYQTHLTPAWFHGTSCLACSPSHLCPAVSYATNPLKIVS